MLMKVLLSDVRIALASYIEVEVLLVGFVPTVYKHEDHLKNLIAWQ